MSKTTFTILFALICLLPAPLRRQDPAPPPLLTFNDLKRDDLKGPFKIEGFVVESYKCPPCPRGAMCKPCVGDHVVITDNVNEQDPALIRRLWVFTDKPKQFELKKKYLLLVKVRGNTRPGHPIEQVDLVGFEPLNAAQPPELQQRTRIE